MFDFFDHRDENEQEDYQEKIVLRLAEQEEDDLERIKEESRRRREAILEKHRSQKTQQHSEAKIENTGNSISFALFVLIGCLCMIFFVLDSFRVQQHWFLEYLFFMA